MTATVPLMFACTACARRIAIAGEWAGKQVRCPHCRAVVVAPAASDPEPAPVAYAPPAYAPPPAASPEPPPAPEFQALASGTQKEGRESIFADPDADFDDESDVIAANRRPPSTPPKAFPPAPKPPAGLQTTAIPPEFLAPPAPTPAPPGYYQPPAYGPAPTLPEPVAPVYAPPAEPANPFAHYPAQPQAGGYSPPPAYAPAPVAPAAPTALEPSRSKRLTPPAPKKPKNWLAIGLGVYAGFATLAAVAGWARSPAATPPSPTKSAPANKAGKKPSAAVGVPAPPRA